MKKFIAVPQKNAYSYDGSVKPRTDLAYFLSSEGFKPFEVLMYQGVDMAYINTITEKIKASVSQGDIFLFQTPVYSSVYYETSMADAVRSKGGIPIAIVHDLDYLRGLAELEPQLEILRHMSGLITSSERMSTFIRQYGVKLPMVARGPWDFQTADINRLAKFDKKVTYAGNLVNGKASFLYDWPKDVKIDIYGPNKPLDLPEYLQTSYKGIKDGTQLPQDLTSGFGLIWEGGDKASRSYSTYLRYNWSFKLGMYLSANLPIIADAKSQTGQFVSDNKLGYALDSLDELPALLDNVTELSYNTLAKQASKFGQKVRSGYFAQSAVKELLGLLVPDDKPEAKPAGLAKQPTKKRVAKKVTTKRVAKKTAGVVGKK